MTLAQVLCYTLDEIETIQPFVFLSADTFRNVRLPCNSPLIDNLDLSAWAEREFDINNNIDFKRDLEFPDDASRRTKRSKTKTKTRTTTARPKTTTKTRNKTKKKQAKPGFKVKITNVTTSSVKLENKYGSGNRVPVKAVPPRPVYRPQSYHDDTEVTYLTGVTPIKASQNSPVKPLEVNIKIQYFLPTVEQTTTIRPTRKKKKNPTRRPTTSYGDTILITQRPPNKNPQTSYSNIVQSQGYEDFSVRPNNLFEKPTNKPRPIDVDNRHPTYTNRPVQIYDEEHFDAYRPSTNYYKPITGTYTYANPPTKTPYVARPQTSYQTAYEDLPFSTSHSPYPYDPHANRRPSLRPQQNGYDDEIYDYVKRPATNQDKLDDVYEHIFNEHDRVGDVPKKPTFGHTDHTRYPDRIGEKPAFEQSEHFDTRYPDRTGKPTKIYSIAHIHKLDNDHIDDKLDFKTRLMTRPKGQDDYDDGRFVKISSVKAGVVVNDRDGESYTVQERDGEVDLLGEEQSDDKVDKIRVVDIQVSPSEIE